MHRARVIWPCLFALAVFMGSSIFTFAATFPAQTLNLPEDGSSISGDDDDVPDVTARVARISFLKGDAQIRRSDGGEWENAALNLPVVEGDEITTGADSRLEIQFDNYQHARLAENAYIKIVNLKDEGIAVSLSLGTLRASITRFDVDKAYFEIDAPSTTLAVQKAGVYRVDAGSEGDAQIRVSVTNDGEARVYSDSAGFTLKNNRSAQVFISGTNAGEWEATDSSRYADEFDSWSLDRDSTIADRLKDAFYDKYYDNDIYGADDLNGYGEWIHTAKYGYVWRPFSNATSLYTDWSPYRYGHWRWVPPFGWTWINDEPWGWATYHHGRWLYDDGYWYWSPYAAYRYTRSWWFPALVVLNVFNNNVCWYPLPYNYGYYNYNHYYNSHHGGYHNGHPPVIYPTGGIKPIPTRVPFVIPPASVVGMDVGGFGTGVHGVRTVPLSVANAVLAKKPDEMTEPVLPAYSALTKKIGRDIAAERPRSGVAAAQTKVGAAPRKPDVPLDKELRTTRIFGGRQPLTKADDTGGVRSTNTGSSGTRKTGAVERQPIVKQNDGETPIKHPPGKMPPARTGTADDSQTVKTPRSEPPVRQPPRSESTPVKEAPKSEPAPTKQPSPKSDTKQESKPKDSDNASKKAKDG